MCGGEGFRRKCERKWTRTPRAYVHVTLDLNHTLKICVSVENWECVLWNSNDNSNHICFL